MCSVRCAHPHPRQASEFFAGYLLEQSLSVDNLFVFVLLFSYFKARRQQLSASCVGASSLTRSMLLCVLCVLCVRRTTTTGAERV
jgi:predicted tellurium resistance membrane protein TerC